MRPHSMSSWTWGLKTRHQLFGSLFREKLDFLRKSEWWPPERLREYQDEKLRRIIRHAYDTVPHYREQMMSLGVSPRQIQTQRDLARLPILSKREARSCAARLASSTFAGKRPRADYTGGTTGSPMMISLTREEAVFRRALWWRYAARFGLGVRDKYLNVTPSLAGVQCSAPLWEYNRPLRRGFLYSHALTTESIRKVKEWLDREEFVFFIGYPSALYVLALLMMEERITLRSIPRHVGSGIEVLLPRFWRTIRDAFGATLTESYGFAEGCGSFAGCEQGRLHLDAESCVVELLPIPGCEETPYRRLVFTGLANRSMPFIRYEVGDYVLPAQGPCPCGRQTLAVQSIEGRLEDCLHLPDGRTIAGLGRSLTWPSGVKELQVVQTAADVLEVNIVPGSLYSKRDEESVVQDLRARLGTHVDIRVKTSKRILLTGLEKFRPVISRIDQAPS